MIAYRRDRLPSVAQVIELYAATALGARRPIAEPRRIEAMLVHANLIVAAWDGEVLVGLARAFTDFLYVTYLADLAVRESYQGQGIGTELMRQTQAAAPEAMIVLLAAPSAATYYPHVGLTHHPQAWVLKPGDILG